MELEPLLKALLAALMLLENSDDSEIDPDVAVAGMEAIAAELHQLSRHDVAELVAAVMRIADAEEDVRYSEFYRAAPTMLGLPPANDTGPGGAGG